MGLIKALEDGLRDTRGGGLLLPGLGSGLAWLGLAWSGLAVYERRRSLCRPVMERETNA